MRHAFAFILSLVLAAPAFAALTQFSGLVIAVAGGDTISVALPRQDNKRERI